MSERPKASGKFAAFYFAMLVAAILPQWVWGSWSDALGATALATLGFLVGGAVVAWVNDRDA